MSWVYSDQWAAGFFDGEGSVSISKRQRTKGFLEHHLSVQIVQTNKAALEEIQKRYGGSLTKGKGQNLPVWRLRFHGTKATGFLEAILPYSLVKREEILIALKLRSAIGIPGQRSNEGAQRTKEEAFMELQEVRRRQGRIK